MKYSMCSSVTELMLWMGIQQWGTDSIRSVIDMDIEQDKASPEG